MAFYFALKICSFRPGRFCFLYNTVITLLYRRKKNVFYCILEALSKCECVHVHTHVRVCNSACVNHQLVNCPPLRPPKSGSEVMRVTQYQTKETASPGDSSPLAEPMTAPSPHGRPRLTHTHPSVPPSLTPFLLLCSVAACFLPTCMQAKTHAYSPAPSPTRQKLRAPPPSSDGP